MLNENYFPSVSFKFNDVDRSDDDTVSPSFNISHNNGTATLAETLILTKTNMTGKWTAKMEINTDDVESTTPTEAAILLAARLHRMAESLDIGKFDTIKLSSL